MGSCPPLRRLHGRPCHAAPGSVSVLRDIHRRGLCVSFCMGCAKLNAPRAVGLFYYPVLKVLAESGTTLSRRKERQAAVSWRTLSFLFTSQTPERCMAARGDPSHRATRLQSQHISQPCWQVFFHESFSFKRGANGRYVA